MCRPMDAGALEAAAAAAAQRKKALQKVAGGGAPAAAATEAAPAAQKEKAGHTKNKDAHLFQKTRMCKFYAKGQCTRGHRCSFAHQADELRPQPDFFHTRMCGDYLASGKCEAGEACKFAHSEGEIRPATLHRNKARGGKKAADTNNSNGDQALLVQQLEAMKQQTMLLQMQVQALSSGQGVPVQALSSGQGVQVQQLSTGQGVVMQNAGQGVVVQCPVVFGCEPWGADGSGTAAPPPTASRSMPLAAAPLPPMSLHSTQVGEGSAHEFSSQTTAENFSDDDNDSLWTPPDADSSIGTNEGSGNPGDSSPSSATIVSSSSEEDLEVHVKNTFLHIEPHSAHGGDARHRARSVPAHKAV